MKNKVMCLTMAFAFACGFTTVHAEDTAEWTVTFDGTNLNDSAEVNTVLTDNGLLPGDTITMATTLKNDSSIATNWYIDNEGIEPLTQGKGSFEYKLTFNDQTIYESRTVASNEDEPNTLKEVELDGFTWLGTLQAGETAKVNLTLTVDGEVQGNTYFNDAAKLYEVYAVESAEPLVTEKNVIKTIKKTKVVNTGDNSGNFLGIAWVALVAAIACIIIVFVTRKKEEA